MFCHRIKPDFTMYVEAKLLSKTAKMHNFGFRKHQKKKVIKYIYYCNMPRWLHSAVSCVFSACIVNKQLTFGQRAEIPDILQETRKLAKPLTWNCGWSGIFYENQVWRSGRPWGYVHVTFLEVSSRHFLLSIVMSSIFADFQSLTNSAWSQSKS